MSEFEFGKTYKNRYGDLFTAERYDGQVAIGKLRRTADGPEVPSRQPHPRAATWKEVTDD